MKNIIVVYLFFFSFSYSITPAIDCDYITKNGDGKPEGYYLGRIYPNPFGPTSFIEFGLPDTSKISIIIYDVYGVSFYNISCRLTGGNYSFNWGSLFNNSDFKSGIYYMKLISDFDRTLKAGTEMHFEGTSKFVAVR